VLFNISINSLVTDIKALDIGIDIECEKNWYCFVCRSYVLIAENENDLQLLLDILNT
jgi:ferredoxin